MVSLLELEPDFVASLPAEEREIAGRVRVPVHTAGGAADADVGALLGEGGAFGVVVVEGLLLHRLCVCDQVAVRVLGAGDVVMRGRDPRLMCLAGSELMAHEGARVALLESAVLSAVRRWPELMLRLLERVAESSQMLEAQLVICQLPRVDQRLSALLWLLAERWGRVTSAGTFLPLQFTHETLGALIGARRSTVTLALTELADRGELVRHADGWLLLEAPPSSDAIPSTHLEMPRLASPARSPWQERASLHNRLFPTVIAYSDAIRGESERERALSAGHRDRARVLRERSQQLYMPGSNRSNGSGHRAP